MYKVKVAIIGIVCVLLSLCVQQTSYAHAPSRTELDDLELKLENDKDQVEATKNTYNLVKTDMEALIDDWHSDTMTVDADWESALTRASIGIVAAATVYATGGIALAYGPAIWLAYLSGRDAVDASSIDLTQYLEAMVTVQDLMDGALTDIQTAYRDGGTIIMPKADMDGNIEYNDEGKILIREQKARGYLNTYIAYMKAGAGYMERNADDEAVVQAFFDEVQDNNGEATVGSDSYQHTHTFKTQSLYKHYPNPQSDGSYDTFLWVTIGLAKDHPCGGVCGQNFGTPLGDHGEVCTACRDIYYSCNLNTYEDEKDEHKVQPCGMKVWFLLKVAHNSVTDQPAVLMEVDCPHEYRDCTPNRNKHIIDEPYGTHKSRCSSTYPWEVNPYRPQDFTLTSEMTTITLTWRAPISSGSSDITDYKYRYKKTGGFAFTNSDVEYSAGTDFSETITDLEPNTTYMVELRAYNSTVGSDPISKSVRTEVFTPSLSFFTPSLSLTYTSSTGSVSMTANANEPIFGADLYIYFPDRTYDEDNKYGTKIGWTSGNSNATTYSLPVNYSFPPSAASGTYKFTLRVYPFNNSGSGDAWGDPYDVFEDVTVD